MDLARWDRILLLVGRDALDREPVAVQQAGTSPTDVLTRTALRIWDDGFDREARSRGLWGFLRWLAGSVSRRGEASPEEPTSCAPPDLIAGSSDVRTRAYVGKSTQNEVERHVIAVEKGDRYQLGLAAKGEHRVTSVDIDDYHDQGSIALRSQDPNQLELIMALEDAEEGLRLLDAFEETLTEQADQLRLFRAVRAGTDWSDARRSLGLAQSVENNVRNKFRRFCDARNT